MDRRSDDILEFDEIRERLAQTCQSPHGVGAARTVEPATDVAEVIRRQAVTAEALTVDRLGVGVSAGATLISDDVAVAARSGSLDIAALTGIAQTARVCDELAMSITTHVAEAPLLAADAAGIDRDRLDDVVTSIDAALDGHGGVRDSASVELGRARRALAQAIAGAAEAMRTAAGRAHSHLQETFVTQRSGRPVLAVKASSRSAVPGIVHDRSATGQTIFVEPLEVVEANNRVREHEAEERIEVERVLARLSTLVGENAGALQAGEETLARLDLALALAGVSRRWDGCAVTIADHVDLASARHPLLDPAAAVPIDLPLEGVRALVVSGPNAGGKTVSLKTLGVFVLMHQIGLRVPARSATLPVFADVLADIGDDQSIERSLSTFSAHVQRLGEILDATGPRTLVLLDEVAAGTDPAEGAALARAVLEEFVARGALVLATTHHHELKAWASETPSAANAAVGFDAARLAPTFTIHVGEPGASHAIETAERLGMDDAIIVRSRELVGDERGALETLLQDASAARIAAEAERDGAIAERDEAARVRVELEQRDAELAAQVERMRRDRQREQERARDAARSELTELQGELTELRGQISAARQAEARRQRSTASRGDQSERDRRLGRAVEATRAAQERLTALSRPSAPPADLVVGERVVVADLGVRGTVISISGGMVELQGPSARLRVDMARLMRDGRIDAPEVVASAPIEARPALVAVSAEIDVRGQRADEARQAVRAHIDAAATVGLEAIRIIHGRGTGALRTAIGEELRRHPLVGGVAVGGPNDGGDGATIATLA